MAKPILTAARVRELFYYCRTSGALYNKKRRKGVAAGTIAGTVRTDGRIQIMVGGKGYKAHRLIWLYVHGEWPNHSIDHIDGDQTNNKIENLRDVEPATNSQNMRKATSRSQSGLLGAYKRSNAKGYYSMIHANGVRHYLGRFGTAEEAHKAYVTAKREIHDGCTI